MRVFFGNALDAFDFARFCRVIANDVRSPFKTLDNRQARRPAFGPFVPARLSAFEQNIQGYDVDASFVFGSSGDRDMAHSP